MEKKTIKPTEKEMEILQVLWERGASSVKEVHEALGGDSRNGYTTILKFMQIMFEKGLVTRQKSGKLHLYKAVASLETTRQQLVEKMIDTVFKGSAAQLVMSALGHKKSSREELDRIREYLDSLDNKEQQK
ncbi:MAG TPA: BlaI/MecI/CopY family transcriptional regulator [Ohtaekwangia sp.]|nr:BlaI/MecI/CopY family transcriptional regulator [Ohtaekwangia sp.]